MPHDDPQTNARKLHVLYLAIISVLIVILVYVSARAVRANRTMKEVEERFGLGGDIRSSAPRDEPLREISSEGLLREKSFDEYCEEVNNLVERASVLGDFGRGELAEACAHALRGGKRLRSIIILEICRAATVRARGDARENRASLVDPAEAALFIEYLHTASLIIDDLPAFDDDNERRGKPTVHAITNVATAQMAALSLLAAAFQNICRQIDWIRDNCPEFKNVDRIGTRLCHDVSMAIGAMGAAGGQIATSTGDAQDTTRDPNAVLEIARMKTASFFEIAFLVGWLISGASPADATDIQRAGRHFGLAFQIADDLGDMEEDANRANRVSAVNAVNTDWNFANLYGVDEAHRRITQNLNACRLIMQEKNIYTPIWQEIYEKVWGMAG